MNVLCAFPYATPRVLDMLAKNAHRLTVMIDSGAFTAWKAGTSIALADYEAFLRALPIKPWAYMALDVVGDPAATRHNVEEMRAHGFDPMPVFTRGESIEEAHRLLSETRRIAVGGLVSRLQDPRAYVLHLRNAGLDLGRCHLLGFVRPDWIKLFRPESIDASSWERSRRFGIVSVYLGHGRLWSGSIRELPRAPREAWARARMMGFDLADLRHRASWLGSQKAISAQITTASYLWMATEMERNIGTRYFLSFSGDDGFGLLLDAHTRLVDRGILSNQ